MIPKHPKPMLFPLPTQGSYRTSPLISPSSSSQICMTKHARTEVQSCLHQCLGENLIILTHCLIWSSVRENFVDSFLMKPNRRTSFCSTPYRMMATNWQQTPRLQPVQWKKSPEFGRLVPTTTCLHQATPAGCSVDAATACPCTKRSFMPMAGSGCFPPTKPAWLPPAVPPAPALLRTVRRARQSSCAWQREDFQTHVFTFSPKPRCFCYVL